MTNVPDGSACPKARLIARVMVFWAGYLAILWAASVVKAKLPQESGALVWGLLSSAAIVPLTLTFLRKENRKPQDIGLGLNRTSFLRLIIGVLIGLAVFALQLLLVHIVAGPMHLALAGRATLLPFAIPVVTTFALSCMEELGFRGYPLRTLVPGIGLWPAQGVVAIAFGLCHLAFGWTWSTILLGVVPSALLFGMVAISSRGLAMPIGLHAGVNLAQASLSGNSNWGFLTLTMEEPVRNKVALLAPISGVAVTAAAILLFWFWNRCRERQRSDSIAAP